MAKELVKTAYGSYVGPGSQFRVVVKVYAEDIGTGQKLTLQRYVQVVAGTNGFQGTNCNITWGDGLVQLFKDGNYGFYENDWKTLGYGESEPVQAKDAKAYYTSSTGKYYESSVGFTYTVPTPSYTVKYDMNGGTGSIEDQIKTYGKSLTLSKTVPTRTGYTFKNWNTKEDGSGTPYAAGASYDANAGATLYAQWTLITYDVVFDGNGGTGAPSKQTKQYGVTLTLSKTIPVWEYHKFLGWATSKTGNVVYHPGDAYTANAAITLYAVWKEEGVTFLNQDEEILKGKMILNDDGDQITGIPLMKINGTWKKGGA